MFLVIHTCVRFNVFSWVNLKGWAFCLKKRQLPYVASLKRPCSSNPQSTKRNKSHPWSQHFALFQHYAIFLNSVLRNCENIRLNIVLLMFIHNVWQIILNSLSALCCLLPFCRIPWHLSQQKLRPFDFSAENTVQIKRRTKEYLGYFCLLKCQLSSWETFPDLMVLQLIMTYSGGNGVWKKEKSIGEIVVNMLIRT